MCHTKQYSEYIYILVGN